MCRLITSVVHTCSHPSTTQAHSTKTLTLPGPDPNVGRTIPCASALARHEDIISGRIPSSLQSTPAPAPFLPTSMYSNHDIFAYGFGIPDLMLETPFSESPPAMTTTTTVLQPTRISPSPPPTPQPQELPSYSPFPAGYLVRPCPITPAPFPTNSSYNRHHSTDARANIESHLCDLSARKPCVYVREAPLLCKPGCAEGGNWPMLFAQRGQWVADEEWRAVMRRREMVSSLLGGVERAEGWPRMLSEREARVRDEEVRRGVVRMREERERRAGLVGSGVGEKKRDSFFG
ncbi:hypothetical protein K402DRAFT_394853 [Aulographum hederae CBS 113979]|uniref:Uncharacterized protein n=1 Tax=Aulographum hederae CBS 113979 TaxID=1176131 RepID=A0A6G1GWG5_9PEZI|nr:hypothetical protein K402DRAFT_394853 [Aulographum hederae CBS 113979]